MYAKFASENLKRTNRLAVSRRRWEDNIKMHLKLDACSSRQSPVAGSREEVKIIGFYKGVEFLDSFSSRLLFVVKL
jgi:hypothetical protein